MYGQIKPDIGVILRKLCQQKGEKLQKLEYAKTIYTY